MNSLDLALGIALTVSLLVNGLFFWYIRNTTNRLLYISENINDLISLIGVYREHLKAIYEMEMFYGDETLAHLVEHSKSLSEQLETFEYIYSLTEADDQKEVEYDDEEPPEEA